MDKVLAWLENHLYEPWLLSPINPILPRDTLLRQFLGLYILVTFGGILFYLVAAAASYFLVFDKGLQKHHLFLPNQIRREIGVSCKSLLTMGVFESTCFLLEVRGHSKLHYSEDSLSTLAWSVATFVLFTDCAIYWIHRALHVPFLYRTLHKTHHIWKVPTPFASHAFHPLDGFLQSLPYHVYILLFPMNAWLFLSMFVFVNFWTISIHDGNYSVPLCLRPFINGAAHHTDHHLFYNFNYGQFFTFWDRIGGSFREPCVFSEGNSDSSLLTKHD